MQPLNSLTFVRFGNANSHKYNINKKQLRSLRNLAKKIDKEWKLLGIDWNVLDWNNNLYDNHWSYSKGVEYYKGKVASVEMIAYKDNQEQLIDEWQENNKEIVERFKKLFNYCRFRKDSYHYPPQKRGLYAFPQYRIEPFLSHWDETKFHIKHCKVGTENESFRRRAKNYITIDYKKPTLWCHFIEEAQELGVAIKVSRYWVLVKSSDYLKVLRLWENKRLKQHRNDYGRFGVIVKHCYRFGSKDDLEVFLVGV